MTALDLATFIKNSDSLIGHTSSEWFEIAIEFFHLEDFSKLLKNKGYLEEEGMLCNITESYISIDISQILKDFEIDPKELLTLKLSL